MIIERVTDATRVNQILNDPSVYPWIKGDHTQPMDMTDAIANKNNVVLLSQYGCVLFIKIQPGIYDFHTAVLPEGRGTWMQEGAASVFHWMFTKTDAYELMTQCPENNVLAKLGARNVGCNLQFKTNPIWPTQAAVVPVEVYSLILQSWAIKAPGMEDIGHQFHEILISQYKKLSREIKVETEDMTHDRYVGVCIEMIRGGQVQKAVNFYNRWAVMSGYIPISVVNKDPLILDISEAKIRVINNSFEVL